VRDRYSEVAQRLRVDVAAAVRRAQRRHIMRLAARYTAVVIVTAGLVTAGVLARKYVQSLASPWRLLLILLVSLTIAIAIYLIASLRRSAILPRSGLEPGRVGQNLWHSVVRFTMNPAPTWVIILAVATVLIAAGALAYDNWPVATEWQVSSDLLVSLSVGAGALLAAALARTAFHRWRAPQEQRSERRPAELPDDVRAEPHTRPVEVGVEPVPDGTRTFALRLQPHADPGTQTLQEVTR
jgi:protein-S-isoprenylcysteine O-methyltransferase Ste14